MDKSDADILSRHLEPGEKVVWIGRPSDRLFVFNLWNGTGFIVHSFFALITGFAALTFTLAGNEEPVVTLWMMFGLFLYISLGRCYVDRSKRRNTLYALTNQRALIKRLHPYAAFRRMKIKPTTTIVHIGQSVRFGPAVNFGMFFDYLHWYLLDDGSFTFRAIEGAVNVAHMAREVREALND